MSHRYTEEQKGFIREIAPGRYNQEIAELFNARFGTNVTESQIKSFKANHKIKSNVPRKRVTDDDGLFTKEQKEFIKSNAKGLKNKELADLVNKTFGLSITARQMNTWKKNHGVTSGLDCRFKNGHVPANKGTKGKFNVGGNRTSFKKGHKPLNYKPIGSERIDRDGYTLIKVQDDGPWHKRWRYKHRVMWEKENGPIPDGHALLFADGNKQNITLDNLILVSRKQMATLNKKGLITNDSDLTRTGIVIADIYQKISERKKLNKRRMPMKNSNTKKDRPKATK